MNTLTEELDSKGRKLDHVEVDIIIREKIDEIIARINKHEENHILK